MSKNNNIARVGWHSVLLKTQYGKGWWVSVRSQGIAKKRNTVRVGGYGVLQKVQHGKGWWVSRVAKTQ